MLRFSVIKILRAIVTMWLVMTFVFIVLRATGDPVEQLLPDDAEPAVLDFYRAKWGLDQPLHIQYFRYLQALSHGDFGISFKNNLPALELIMERVPKTAILGGAALFLGLLFGIPLGIIAAVKRNTWFDRMVMSFAVFGFSMPNFFLGILLIILFSLSLRWLPSSGSDTIWHLVMPVITLGTAFGASIARYTRSSMIDVLSKPYMLTASSKGAAPQRRTYLHALPNAALPLVTIIGLKMGEILGGAVVTETVFAWPGLGRLLVVSVATRDLAVVQCILMLIALTMVLANLTVDIVYGFLDPRISVGYSNGRK